VLRASEVEEVCALGLVEPQRTRECLEDGLGDAGGIAALELRRSPGACPRAAP
jgi:hypothetical protein